MLAPRGSVPSGCLTISQMGCGLSPRQRGGCSSCGQRAEAPGPWGGSEPAWSSGRAPGCVCWGTEAWGAPRLGQKPHPTHTPWPGSLASSAPHQGLCIQGSCGRVHLTELLWGRCTQVRSLQVNLGVLTGDVRGVGVQTRPRVHVALAGTLPHSPPRASVSQPQGVRASPGSAPPPAECRWASTSLPVSSEPCCRGPGAGLGPGGDTPTGTPLLRTSIVSALPARAHTHSHPLPGPEDPRLGPGPQGAQEDAPGLEGMVTPEMQEGPPHSRDPLQAPGLSQASATCRRSPPLLPGPAFTTATCPACPAAGASAQTSSSSTSVSPAPRAPLASAAPPPHPSPWPPAPHPHCHQHPRQHPPHGLRQHPRPAAPSPPWPHAPTGGGHDLGAAPCSQKAPGGPDPED